MMDPKNTNPKRKRALPNTNPKRKRGLLTRSQTLANAMSLLAILTLAFAPTTSFAQEAPAAASATTATETAAPTAESSDTNEQKTETNETEPAKDLETNPGRTGRLEQIILPGSLLEVKRQESDSPIVVRIVESFPHGPDMNRYDIEYYGLDPGEYNLSQYFERIDGSELGELPELNVTVEPLLPPGQIEPQELPAPALPKVGGYRNLMILLSALWVIGLLVIIFWRSSSPEEKAASRRKMSMADRLRPLVSDAIAGKLDRKQYADLEMSLVSYWRKKLKMEDTDASNAIGELKKHEDAGPLLSQLERWLHEPGQSERVDVAELLKPYENLPSDAIEFHTAGATK